MDIRPLSDIEAHDEAEARRIITAAHHPGNTPAPVAQPGRPSVSRLAADIAGVLTAAAVAAVRSTARERWSSGHGAESTPPHSPSRAPPRSLWSLSSASPPA
ncbi:hypothetical protein CRV15_29450 (plasmid) [Streptomyces clavuligerus]|uniref:Uncharacterized protein n=1 Tax=Streptomyces clavuligerus TaxID=1901 RepID=B5GRW4_STRCL|nr:hypothetical protein SSCG_02088 [Streptomyces clavuligerus]EFG03760.1 Hypothetical protein SCLAV_p0269 [Streptomyces clavuligerus]QCS09747.1 hypothetical protein CRV15_29450 [Streptomyces clavuligerus]QPJ98208.1 hypothetical protein GE265_34950 [Streptomyces clavuligerus]